MEFSRQEYWSGLVFPSPGYFPNSETEPESPALAGGFFTTELPGKPMPTDVENLARHFTRSEKNKGTSNSLYEKREW